MDVQSASQHISRPDNPEITTTVHPRDYSTLAIENAELKAQIEHLKSKVHEIVAAAVKEERNKTRATLRTGREVRNRHLELCRQVLSEKGKDVINLGNMAAHSGRPSADASLYDASTPEEYRRIDWETYQALYGVKWETVMRLKVVRPFMEFVRFYGTVKEWHPNDFQLTDFYRALPAYPGPDFDKMGVVDAEAYFAQPISQHRRVVLRRLYNRELENHKETRQERRKSE